MLVAQLYPTFCDLMDFSQPGFSVHGICQARILEWVAISFSRGIFLTWGTNTGVLHWQEDSLPLSHQESPSYFFTFVQFALSFPPESKWFTFTIDWFEEAGDFFKRTQERSAIWRLWFLENRAFVYPCHLFLSVAVTPLRRAGDYFFRCEVHQYSAIIIIVLV